MENFKLFILGSLGYLLVGMYDIAILYNKSLLKKLFSIGFLLTTTPYMFLFYFNRSPHSTYWIIGLFVLMALFVALLIYSVFIETALFSSRTSKLYTKGTYSFSRHPGFLWYTIVNLLVAVFFWDWGITLLCLGLIFCNFVLIILEDTYIFPKIFLEYDQYKLHTPMVLSLKILPWRVD